MELNRIATGIKLVGTTIKEISVENNIVNVQKEAKRSFEFIKHIRNLSESASDIYEEGEYLQWKLYKKNVIMRQMPHKLTKTGAKIRKCAEQEKKRE